MFAKHLKIKPFKCEKCDYRTSNKNDVKIHMKLKHNSEKQFLKCKKCSKVFGTQRVLNSHLKHHDGYFCETCEKYLATSRQFRIHLKEVHLTKENLYGCKVCSTKFKTHHELVIHLQKTHPKLIKCQESQCNSLFRLAENMERHHNEVHLRIVNKSVRIEYQNLFM